VKRFNVGDRVVIVRSPAPGRIGEVTTVISELTPHPMTGPGYVWRSHLPVGTPMHILDSDSRITPGCKIAYPPEYLEPYIPDDREPIAWSEDLIRLVGNGLFPARKEPVR
jgi:hypothetical protein